MNIAIVSNIENGIGLHRDYLLLKEFLEGLGHEVRGLQYDAPIPFGRPTFDLMISLETIAREFLPLAPVHWWFPNPEWTYEKDLELAGRCFAKMLVKTHEGERIFKGLFPEKTHYVGFLTRDQFDPSIERKKKFLHIGGNSSFRGTQEVLDAWKWEKDGQRIGAELIIISTALKDCEPVDGVTFLEKVSDEELKLWQNECAFHLYPSGTEGFGHALHESLSVNALILTTNAPPMNEINAPFLVPSVGQFAYNLATIHEVSALDIHERAKEMLMPDFHVNDARNRLLQANAAFREAFGAHLEDLRAPSPQMARNASGKRRIAFLGNFEAPESTENLVRWALEQRLNCEIEPIQENVSFLHHIEAAVNFCDLFLWVKTPNWLQVSDADMEEFLQRLKIPSVSLHLDKFWGIPDREAQIGKHPFWKTSFVFTADGSRQEDFKKRGVNHFWMQPAMSEVHLHPGAPKDAYRFDVGFIGAKGYHKEYPFREKLVDFLQETYKGRFKHFLGVRGHELNDVYASLKVIVGDCFGAGIPYYWSDRLPETCGRYGFLIHPQIEGAKIPTATYLPQDLDDLKFQIDYWLAHDLERYAITRMCAAHVRMHDTWSVRMREILDIVGQR
jgi:hypothetical protein